MYESKIFGIIVQNISQSIKMYTQIIILRVIAVGFLSF